MNRKENYPRGKFLPAAARPTLAGLFVALTLSLSACSASKTIVVVVTATPEVAAIPEPTFTPAFLPTSTPLLLPSPTSPAMPAAASRTPTQRLPTPIPATPTPAYILWDEAAAHIGETLTVCGPVMGAHFAKTSNGKPTFLNIGAPYPDPQRFTVLIWGRNRDKFPGPPEEIYLEQNICVTGEIEAYNGSVEIVVEDPSQIVIQQ